MAMFALGLAKTAVEGTAWTLSLVKSAVEEEAELKKKVQNDLVFISGEFEMMQSFLRVANKESAQNEVVLTWVRQLRNLAFDVEDCVEFVVHLEIKSRWGWLWRAWQKVYCCASPLPLDVAIAEIKQLKARVEDVSLRNTRYNLIRDSNNKSTSAVMPPTEDPEDANSYPSSAFNILRDVWEATGTKQRNIVSLEELIVRGDDDLQVISVWGSTGGCDLGMASIFRKAYCDKKICEKFRSRAWVKLIHPFNHDEFVKSLLTQFYASSQPHSHQANVEVTEDNLMKQMREQRYLLVLEDVFTVAEWDVIRMYLPDSKKGSRIVLTTPQLGIALLCTGEPYHVSELRHFSDDQFLCAIFRKTRTDMGEFNWQLQRRGVISVWGAGDHKSMLVDKMYRGILNRWKYIDGVVEFERHSWVDVPNPLDLKVFAQRLFLNFHSDDIRASEMKAVCNNDGQADLIQWCCKFLFEEDCLMVINGLQSRNDWDLIKSTFLLSNSKLTIKGCIIVITDEEIVATHCVKDHKYGAALNIKDLEADTAIVALINKGFYGLGGKKGHLFYSRKEDALEWSNKFKDVGGNPADDQEKKDEEEFGELVTLKKEFGVLVVNGAAGFRVKAFFRNEYYGNGRFFPLIKWRSWVDVPDSFDLMDFSWCLLLDFYSDDPQAKEAVALDLMEGKINPIQECLKFLREQHCLVVIDGLRSRKDWDLINGTFFSEPILQSIIIVTATDDSVATHCEPYKLIGGEDVPHIRGIIKAYESLFLSERRKKATEWIEKFEPLGREIEGFKLTQLVLCLDVSSVWGIAGVGKSSLVRSVYYTQMLHLNKFYRCFGSSVAYLSPDKFVSFGWVDVPKPFNLTELSCRLLLDLYSDDPRAKETAAVSMMEGQDPIEGCCKFLRQEKCLVVIDGLRSTQDWDLIEATFLSGTKRIKGTIVVITNEEKVAMHCVKNNKTTLNITGLEVDVALNVFKKIAWKGKELTPKEMELWSLIVAKCGELPKVIASIGKACSSNTGVLESLSDNFMGTLETAPRFYSLRDLFSWMQSYFAACSDSIKPCIFYLSIFSAEKNIRRRRLLWRWVAEGYCRDTSDGRTCEENGEKFISELVNLSIVQQSRSKSCKINGFFHEYIISRPMEDNLVFPLEGRCSLNSQRAGQHLTIRSSWDRDKIVYESIDFSRLRSLTVFGKWDSFFVSSKNINMRLLRVLDLEDAIGVTNDDLKQIGKLLRRLKFLSLRGCREITFLPSSIGGLRQLQTLDITDTSIVTLPLVITKLQKLRYIRAGTTEVWNWEADVVPGEGRASSPAQVSNLPATTATPSEGGTDSTIKVPPPADAQDREATNLPATAATPIEDEDASAPIEDEDHASETLEGSDSMSLPTEGGTDSDSTATVLPLGAGSSVSCNRACTLVSSLLSKLYRCGPDNGGVKVRAQIGKLSALHTLGVVNVNGCFGKSIFKELKKLTQLHKLGVSGINKGNIQEFCSAISGHAHLKSLSVELDKEDNLDGLIVIPDPPKTLNSLKLYGRAHKLLVWINRLHNLRRLKLDLTIVKPKELLDLLLLLNLRALHHIRIRPIKDGELRIPQMISARVVEIQCSSALRLNFYGIRNIVIEVLKVDFSRGSSLEVISGLSHLRTLKEVWLKGYSDAHQLYMHQKINEMELEEHQERPVLKLVKTHSP